MEGVASAVLHRDAREVVSYHELDPGATLSVADRGGIEILMIAGEVQVGEDQLQKGAWLRLPEGEQLTAQAGEAGAKIWMKTGHLPYAQPPAV